ncbi:MAG TPA: LysM peptidoglycan-binding domain-containing protein [Bacteroidia bacterium]|nr:LysM peptidoglycan-binding domain-containing protein [Bacteroidia bacterium]
MMRRLLSYRVFILALPLLLLTATGYAQKDDGVKKSTKTEIVEGKKYYLHTVLKGQTLYAIAKAYDLTVNDILVENPDALNGIKPGQVLRIPAEKKTAQAPPDTAKYVTHKVEAGQTLYSLARQYNTTEQAILDKNPEAKNGLKVGMELKIPLRIASVGLPPDTTIAIPDTIKTVMKDVYNVALMMPLQLWNTANIEPDDIVARPPKAEFPQKPKAAVEFYEGALLAIDSMRKTGMKINVWVYDVDDIDSGKTAGILAKPEFATMDLIIGPFSPGPFDEIADFAAAHNIAIVSPVSPANRVLFKNPMALKTLPSTGTQMEHLAEHIAKERKDDNIIMITSGLLKEQKMCSSFQDKMNGLRTAEGKDSILVNQGFSGVESKLKKDVMNVLVIPSMSQAFVTDLLRNLHTLAEKYKITVYGMPSWMEFENLDPEYMQSLNMHFASPYFVDYDSPATKRFILRYRGVFGGDPTTYSFAGFDVTLFFLQQLQHGGTGFVNQIATTTGEGLQQSFSFVKSDAESGYENTGIRIVHISDYQLVPFGVENPTKDKK